MHEIHKPLMEKKARITLPPVAVHADTGGY